MNRFRAWHTMVTPVVSTLSLILLLALARETGSPLELFELAFVCCYPPLFFWLSNRWYFYGIDRAKLDLSYAFQREGNSLVNLRESKELANLIRSRMYNVSFFSWLLFFVCLFLFLSSKL